MRVFILLCALGSALAAPQGYSYPQQIGGLSITTGGAIGGSAIAHIAPPVVQGTFQSSQSSQTLLNTNQNAQKHGHTQISVPPTFYQPPLRTQQTTLQNTLQTYNTAQAQFNAARQPLITKDIYVHVAPEDPAETVISEPVLPPQQPRKHYRIVFIKAPAQNFGAGALRVKQAPVEEKTIIYVLTKKTDPLDLQQAIQEAAPKQPSKPEVYFIKYKTQEEAQHAQRTIQAQYDQLGGTTQVSDEGIAPVTSVIGALDQQSGAAGMQQQRGGIGTITTTNIDTSSSGNALFTSNINTSGTGATGRIAPNQYLPPVKRH